MPRQMKATFSNSYEPHEESPDHPLNPSITNEDIRPFKSFRAMTTPA